MDTSVNVEEWDTDHSMAVRQANKNTLDNHSLTASCLSHDLKLDRLGALENVTTPGNEKVKPVGEVSLLVLMQGLSIIVPWQLTSLFTAWNCLSYTTRGAFLTKSNLNIFYITLLMRLFRLPPRNCDIQSLKRPKVCALLGYQFLLNTMIFFFFFLQTNPICFMPRQ